MHPVTGLGPASLLEEWETFLSSIDVSSFPYGMQLGVGVPLDGHGAGQCCLYIDSFVPDVSDVLKRPFQLRRTCPLERSPYDDEEAAYQFVRCELHWMVCHEVDEHFLVGGARKYDLHLEEKESA